MATVIQRHLASRTLVAGSFMARHVHGCASARHSVGLLIGLIHNLQPHHDDPRAQRHRICLGADSSAVVLWEALGTLGDTLRRSR